MFRQARGWERICWKPEIKADCRRNQASLQSIDADVVAVIKYE